MRKVTSSIEIEATSASVFNAFLKKEMLSGWWGVERSLVMEKENGLYSLAWNITDRGFGYVTTGIIKIYRPYTELLIDNLTYFNPERPIFGPMSLHIIIEEKTIHSAVHLTQDGYGEGNDWDWYYEAVKQAWPQALMAMKKFLEGNKKPGA